MTKQKRMYSFFVLVLFLSAVSISAQIRVDTDRSLQANIHINAAKLGRVLFAANGKEFTGLYMDHAQLLVSKGSPALPVMSGLVMIAADQKPELEILETKFTEIKIARPIVPSRGAINRNIDPKEVPFKMGAVYKQNKWFPATQKLVKISEPFIFREVRGVRLEAFPVQYNPVTKKLRIYSYIRARLRYQGKGGKNVHRGRAALSRSFAGLYQKAFLNFTSMPKRLSPVNENGRLLIIVADEFRKAMLPFVEWKEKCGISVLMVSTSEIGGAKQENIKSFLQQEFDAAGFTHVILVGDSSQIPTNKGENEGADSDPVYVKLAGDDHVPDAIISRISANSISEVEYQVAKILNYEQYPYTGAKAAWYSQTLGIASNEGTPTDFERMDKLKEALLATNRFREFFTVYDPKHSGGSSGGYGGYPYPGGIDYPGSYPGGFNGPNPHYPSMPMYSLNRSNSRSGTLKSQVFAAVNKGVSFINYIGHGSASSWVTSGFNNQDCQKLENNWMLPVILSVACVNGDFVGNDSFCEAWMNAGSIDDPKGAVAIFGSTTNQSWVPPCEVQTAIVSDFIVNDSYLTVGGLMTNGVIKGLEIYGTERHSEGVKMMEQWHLFGDGTTIIRTRKPFKPSCEVSTESIPGESQVIIKITDPNGEPVKNTRATVYSKDFQLLSTSIPDKDGVVKVNIGLEKGAEGYLTVIGQDMIPVIDQKVRF